MNQKQTLQEPVSIYRQAALQRRSSPAQPARSLAVASPASWLILVATLLIFTAAGVWGWNGSITQAATGDGILIGAGGLVSVTAPGAGQVADLRVKLGDMVRPNDVIAQIGNPMLVEQVRLAEMALAEARREVERSAAVRSAAAKLQSGSNDDHRRNLEREISEFDAQIVFAEEQADNQRKLWTEGLAVKSSFIAAQQKLVEIRAEIARRRTQIADLQVERFNSQAAVEGAAGEAHERIAGLARHLTELREQHAQTTAAISPSGGRVTEIKVYPGAMITAGTPIVTIQPVASELEALIYVPSKQAKQVLPGMDVRLLPGSTQPEERRYLRGTVVTVAAFPVSPVTVLRRFENEALASAITGQGPVTEVRVALHRDSNGAGVPVSAGTLCGARIVTATQRPLTLALPLVREAFGWNR